MMYRLVSARLLDPLRRLHALPLPIGSKGAAAAAFALALALFAPLVLAAPAMTPLGAFTHHQNIGEASLAGSAAHDAAEQTYTLSLSGGRGAALDDLHFVWKKLKGDFILQATLLPQPASEPSRTAGPAAPAKGGSVRQVGVMVREALTGTARYVAGAVHEGIVTALHYRDSEGGASARLPISAFHATELQLERSGNRFTFSAAVFGEGYKSVTQEVTLSEEAFAGLFVSAGEGTTQRVAFSNVRVVIPALAGFKPYSDYLGSHLEVMDLASGRRKILHSEPGSIQAPNWTRDDHLLYNSSAGVMYSFDMASGKVAELNTGSRRQNNNDHVLSFDGKMLALSNYVGEPRRSVAFILPVTGSDEPKQITSPEAGHTYLHGWSPDGKKLVFTGGRKGETGDFRNLWAVDVDTKVETALTPPGTLDDGPEYTPDGKYIYFNSVRTGTMQIWRIRPDGSSPEQITFDEHNNWFPHISPDGKWLLYIAFPKEIDPWSHPFYKHCYLRLMPTAGGAPKTVAYFYGGQGSINTPSWSPDSKRIAFVSNSKL